MTLRTAGYGAVEVARNGESSQRVAVQFAEPADCREIAEVHVRTWQASYQHAFPPEVLEELSVDEREAQWRQRIGDGATVWVAQMRERVVWLRLGRLVSDRRRRRGAVCDLRSS
jgi:hypothetical protein